MAGSAKPSTTTEFAKAIISNLGKISDTGTSREFSAVKLPARKSEVAALPVNKRHVTGVDVYIETTMRPDELGDEMTALTFDTTFALQAITNRGNTVYPLTERSVSLIDSYRCRFLAKTRSDDVGDAEILALLTRIGETHRWNHVEKLQLFDGEDGFSRTPKI